MLMLIECKFKLLYFPSNQCSLLPLPTDGQHIAIFSQSNACHSLAWQWQCPALCWIEDQRKFFSLRLEVAAESKVA